MANTVQLDHILQNFVQNQLGFQAAALVESVGGETITTPIGIDDENARQIACSMLYAAERVEKGFNWKMLGHITIECAEGYCVLVSCSKNQKYFLLVKATKSIKRGLLFSEIDRIVDKIKKIFDVEDDDNHPVKPTNDGLIIPSQDNPQNNEKLWHIPPEDKRVR